MSRAWRTVLMALVAAASVAAAPGDRRALDAARTGNLAALRAALRDRAAVNAPGADGTTALHWAARRNDVAMVKALVAAKANANVVNRYGITPLGLAATNGSAEVTRTLLAGGANPNGTNGDGEPVLMTAARSGAVDVVTLLLDAGADVNARDAWRGETALMWAAGEDHPHVVSALARRGADLNARSKVLEYPKVTVDFATMVFIAMPKGGFTPLLFAARQGSVRAAQALIDAGADMNVADPDGTTPAIMAVINAHYELAALLAERGADLNRADASGMTALYAAVDMAHQEPLVNRPLPKPSGRMGAAEAVASLLDHGADPNPTLKTPLLMRQHNNGDATFGDGATPLMRAAKVSDVTLLRVLLDHGADPNRAMKNGATALMVAVARAARPAPPEAQTIAAIELLQQRGTNVNATNANQETPLHLAVGHGDDVVTYLAEHGASLDAKDAAGRTPLDVALGVPGVRPRGVAAPPAPVVYESTVALLRRLMEVRAPTPAR